MKSPTIKDVARESGVGVGTVSRVLSNSQHIGEGTRLKVMKVIKELNYVPNVAGKRLSQNRSNVLAVIVPVINHPFFSKLIAELEFAADLYGYTLLLASSQRRIQKEEEILRRIAQKEADGAIFVTHFEHDEEEFKNLAIVSIDRHLGKNIPIVTTNNYEATKHGVEYLIKKGCKKIAYLGTKPNQSSEVFLRQKAYSDVMKEHNMEQIIINRTVNHGEEETIINELFDNYKDFDGVFVSGCILANILYEKIQSLNISCPNDIQIVSYDGEFSHSNKAHITTLEQPLELMAKRCVEVLIQLIEHNGENVEKINKFDCRFIKGETTK